MAPGVWCLVTLRHDPKRRVVTTVLVASAILASCGGDDTGADRTAGRTVTTIAYGDDPSQVADLVVPAGEGPFGVVVMIHGGFWRAEFDRSLGTPLCADIAAKGVAACWNIEYRRVGDGGGWPATFDDVAAAIDHLASLDDPRLDLSRVVTVGHSAGGHLAVWAAARQNVPAGFPGADPIVRPVAAVSQAGVLDLVRCADARTGGQACPDLMGGRPDEVPDRYAAASPIMLMPTPATIVALHGDFDGVVPPSQSQSFVDAARRAGQDVELVLLPKTGHFEVIDPTHGAWTEVMLRLPDLLGT